MRVAITFAETKISEMLKAMSVRAKIEQHSSILTQTERKLATALLSDYPYAGLSPIHELAERAEVSPPSISRFVVKLGLSGYAEMQRALLIELRQGALSPVQIHEASETIRGGYLGEFLSRAAAQVNSASTAITEAQFDRICALAAEPRRSLYTIGGRVSDNIARHLAFHLGQARPNVFHLPRDPEVWPEYLLRMKPGDVFFIFDFRRYETQLATLAERAATDRKARIVVITDKWLSPINRTATEVLAVPIETGTIWDSYAAALAVTEALAARIASADWNKVRARITAWDAARNIEGDTGE
ncbi:MAG: MurR/RpiR family transcriptional regulator [Pseudomonadota bacterium]